MNKHGVAHIGVILAIGMIWGVVAVKAVEAMKLLGQ